MSALPVVDRSVPAALLVLVESLRRQALADTAHARATCACVPLSHIKIGAVIGVTLTVILSHLI